MARAKLDVDRKPAKQMEHSSNKSIDSRPCVKLRPPLAIPKCANVSDTAFTWAATASSSPPYKSLSKHAKPNRRAAALPWYEKSKYVSLQDDIGRPMSISLFGNNTIVKSMKSGKV
jgi:hypothetical protein